MPRLIWGEVIGDENCPFLKRWVLRGSLCSIRVHHFYPDHVEDVAHSHPWCFLTLVLRGGYVDTSCHQDIERSYDHMHVGSLRFRMRNHTHKTKTGPDGAWTIVLTGPVTEHWGFWEKGIFIPHRRYFRKRAVCDD